MTKGKTSASKKWVKSKQDGSKNGKARMTKLCPERKKAKGGKD